MILEDTVIAYDRQSTMEAILARDQRTTSHRVLDRTLNPATEINTTKMTMVSAKRYQNQRTSHRRCAGITETRIDGNCYTPRSISCHSCLVSASYDDRGFRSKRNASVTATTWLRLGSLLVILHLVSVQGAPTMTLEDRRLSSPPKWVNPCGLAAEDFDGDLDVVQLRDEQLLNQVVVQAKTALMHAELFRDDYIRRTFNTDFPDLLSTFKSNRFDWLPGSSEIPKQLGEQLEQDYLEKLELDKALLDAYEYMQKYAVGLEQIVWDQDDHRLEFREQFKDTEFKLRTVLCELQVALVERGVTPRPDVTRDTMSADYRNMSSTDTYRNLRDWLIFRDYMNGLEYVVQVFEHLRHGLQS